MADIAGFQLETSLVQRSSWCLAIILACLQWLSFLQVVRFVRCSRYVVDPRRKLVRSGLSSEISSKQWLLSYVVAAFFVLIEVLVIVLSRVFLLLVVGVAWFAVGGDVDTRGTRSFVTFTCLSRCLYDHPNHPSLRCLEFLSSSVVIHVLDA